MASLSEFFARLFHPSSTVDGRSSAVHLTTSGLHETDNTFYPGANMAQHYRSRYDYDRQAVLAECLRSWRLNPIARRIVKLMSMFIVGEGIQVRSDHKATDDFLQSWWNHPLNHLGRQLVPWCDEATRSGNLFFLCTVDQANGMLYVRAVPADQIDEILTAENDIQQEIAYKPVVGADGIRPEPWPAYQPVGLVGPVEPVGQSFMLHYAYNQPVGVAWGEPDLAPMLQWLSRYATWLEDRARLNHFRTSFIYVVRGPYADRAALDARQRELAYNPPQPGSVLVVNDTETWSVINPQLESKDAGEDGLALKKMIAIGAGIPPHYLAEPESSTRTTAEAAGTPTFRGLEQTQACFLSILSELAQIAVQQRKLFDRRVKPDSRIEAVGPDITERDNSLLSLAVSRIYPALIDLYDRKGIPEDEVIRLVYRMAGEANPPASPGDMQRRPLSYPRSGHKPITRANPSSARPSDQASSESNADESDAGVNPPKE